ncbi:class I adenylate-forming enzyme family protein [soil metagenome]
MTAFARDAIGHDVSSPAVSIERVRDLIHRLTAPDGPFEVSQRTVADQTYRAFTHAAPTLVDVLEAGRSHGTADFLVFDDQRWSFVQFFATADAVASALQHDYGVRPGDRVAIAMRNCADWLIVFTAAALVGAVAVPLNSWGSIEELDFTLRNCGASVLAADRTRTALALKTVEDQNIPVLFSGVDGPLNELPHAATRGLRLQPINDIVRDPGRGYLPAPPSPEDVAMLLYTSGSTGSPKGVIYRQIAIGQALMNMFFTGVLTVELGGGVALRGGATAEAPLLTIPLFHAAGLFSGFLVPCVVGQKVALLRKWDPETALQLIEAERITSVSTVPAILKDLLTHPRFDEYDLSSVSRVAAVGAATPADLPDLIREKFGVISRSTGYGMTETTALGATMSGPVFDLNPTASGLLSPIIELRVVDTTSKVSSSASYEGELQLRGVTVTPGYWQLDELTRDAFTVDGWFRTGDLGRLDEDGFLHITGRSKEIVIRGGENIAPVEIENVAYRHAAVKEVAVFGVPDDAMGEELVLVYYENPWSTTLTEGQLRSLLNAHLPAFKVPKYIRLSEQPLPRNASEKIHRAAVRSEFLRE